MKVRPFSAAELLRQDSPRKYASQSNRFATLRDKSPAPGTGTGSRFRYPSVKRKTEESVSYSDATAKNLPQVQSHVDSAQVLEIVGVSTAKVNSLCDKVRTELVTLGAEPEICTIFTNLCEAIKCINDTQSLLAELKSGETKMYSNVLQAPPKRIKQVPSQGNLAPPMVDLATVHQVENETPEEEKTQKLRNKQKNS